MDTETPIRFLVVGAIRSGTNFVLKTLSQHPNLACSTDEIATWPLFTLGCDAFVQSGSNHSRRREKTRRMFDILCDADQTNGARGGKVALSEVGHALDLVCGLRDYFEDAIIVRVSRNDHVSRYASMILAHETNRWFLYPGEERTAKPRCLDVDDFRAFAARSMEMAAITSELSASHQVIDVRFEDLNEPDWHISALESLGVERNDPPENRRATPPLEQWVSNLDEIRRAAAEIAPFETAKEEIEQHDFQNRFAEVPAMLLSRAHHCAITRQAARAKKYAMMALRRDNIPIPLVGRGCAILGRALKQMLSVELAQEVIKELADLHGDAAAILVLRARLELALGHRKQAEEWIALAKPKCHDSDTLEVIQDLLRSLP